jgi:hypothetical protein
MTNEDMKPRIMVGAILEEEVILSFGELCRASRLSAERVIELVHEGIVEPKRGRRRPRPRLAGRAGANEGPVEPVRNLGIGVAVPDSTGAEQLVVS